MRPVSHGGNSGDCDRAVIDNDTAALLVIIELRQRIADLEDQIEKLKSGVTPGGDGS